MTSYQVIVGNVGVVFFGQDLRGAKQEYLEYVAQSVSGIGRAGNESVTLVHSETGDPLLVHLADADAAI